MTNWSTLSSWWKGQKDQTSRWRCHGGWQSSRRYFIFVCLFVCMFCLILKIIKSTLHFNISKLRLSLLVLGCTHVSDTDTEEALIHYRKNETSRPVFCKAWKCKSFHIHKWFNNATEPIGGWAKQHSHKLKTNIVFKLIDSWFLSLFFYLSFSIRFCCFNARQCLSTLGPSSLKVPEVQQTFFKFLLTKHKRNQRWGKMKSQMWYVVCGTFESFAQLCAGWHIFLIWPLV